MASTVTHVVTKTVSSSTTASTSRAAPQGGILEHGNPSIYDPKNPIIVFIIQVSQLSSSGIDFADHTRGWHYNRLLPIAALSSI